MDTAPLSSMLAAAGLSADLTTIIGRRVRFTPRQAMVVVETDKATMEVETPPSERTVKGIEYAPDGLRLLLVTEPPAEPEEAGLFSFMLPVFGIGAQKPFDPYLAFSAGAWHLVMPTPSEAETPLRIAGTFAWL